MLEVVKSSKPDARRALAIAVGTLAFISAGNVEAKPNSSQKALCGAQIASILKHRLVHHEPIAFNLVHDIDWTTVAHGQEKGHRTFVAAKYGHHLFRLIQQGNSLKTIVFREITRPDRQVPNYLSPAYHHGLSPDTNKLVVSLDGQKLPSVPIDYANGEHFLVRVGQTGSIAPGNAVVSPNPIFQPTASGEPEYIRV